MSEIIDQLRALGLDDEMISAVEALEDSPLDMASSFVYDSVEYDGLKAVGSFVYRVSGEAS